MIYSYKNKDTHIYICICNAYVYTIHDNCSLSLEGILNVHFFYNTTNNDELAEIIESETPSRYWGRCTFLKFGKHLMFCSFPQNSPFKPPTPNSGVLKPTHIYLIIKKKLIGNLFMFSLFRNFLGSPKTMGFFPT